VGKGAGTTSLFGRDSRAPLPTDSIDGSRAVVGGHGARELFDVEEPRARLCPPYKSTKNYFAAATDFSSQP
jgi:hypothetical protein